MTVSVLYANVTLTVLAWCSSIVVMAAFTNLSSFFFFSIFPQYSFCGHRGLHPAVVFLQCSGARQTSQWALRSLWQVSCSKSQIVVYLQWSLNMYQLQTAVVLRCLQPQNYRWGLLKERYVAWETAFIQVIGNKWCSYLGCDWPKDSCACCVPTKMYDWQFLKSHDILIQQGDCHWKAACFQICI